MKFYKPNQKTVVLVVSVLVITAVTVYAVSQVMQTQQSKAQSGDLGSSIQDLTQGIIGRTNEQVQNTLESAGQTALPQLQTNASQYDCLVVIMHFGKATGAMTCSSGEGASTSITASTGGNVQSSIQRQGGALSMQNQMQGSGSSANVIPGDVP